MSGASIPPESSNDDAKTRRSTLRYCVTVYRKRGLKTVFGKLWRLISSLVFDLVHGVDTHRQVDVDELGIDTQGRTHASRYSVSNHNAIRKLLEEVIPDPQDHCFVDFGCGKGRVLLLASSHGFRKVSGVEISGSLAEMAIKNSAAYKHGKYKNVISVHHCGAKDYHIGEDEDVFYFFNPFDRETFELVLGNLMDSLADNPRDIILMCSKLKYNLEDICGTLVRSDDLRISGAHFVIYRTGRPDMQST